MWDSIKDLLGSAAPLVGSLVGGPLGGSVGALIADKLGVENDPSKILEKLQTDPEAMVKIKQMESEERQQLRQLKFEEAKLEAQERQHRHETTQKTIQTGDTAEDKYVRQTRPKMARMSFYFGTAYLFVFEIASAFDYGSGADAIMLGTAYGPAFTYMGMRTIDAFSKYKGPKMGGLLNKVINAGKQ